MLRTLDERDLRPEIMDDPELLEDDHLAALRALARINRLSGSGRILWSPLRRYLRGGRSHPVRLLDIACGGGDVLLRLFRRARRAGFDVEWTGADISPRAVEWAREQAARQGADIRFATLDALGDDLPGGFDVITCSLFLHHLTDDQARRLLAKMAQATTRLLLVSDLVRSTMNVALVQFAARMLSRSHVVHFDGPQSVRAAFTVPEFRQLAADAGLPDARVSSRPPCRSLLVWTRP